MATQFTIDDAFVLEGDEVGAVTDGEPQGWKDREGGEMTFGHLSFSKPQSHPSPAATGAPETSNLKYQVHKRYILHVQYLYFGFNFGCSIPTRGCLFHFSSLSV